MELNSEDLENLSPEEMAEIQKKNCIFCQIAKGAVNAKKIYEDDKVIGILDINPANPGHTLLLPKEHYMILPQMPDELVNYIFVIAKGISNALLRAVGATGTNIFIANGVGAGQRAPHFMVHIIPRIDNDGIKCFEIPQSKANIEELEKLSYVVSEIIRTEMEKKKKKDIKLIVKEEPEILQSKERIESNKSKRMGKEKENQTNNEIDGKKKKSRNLDKITDLLLRKK